MGCDVRRRASGAKRGHLKKVILLLLSSVILGDIPVNAQLFTGYRPAEKPGIYGARVHPGALAPNRRKWYLPQNLYYEYAWRGWEYSNYARNDYQRYVNILLEGTRQYDPFGNYIARGWKIYDWTENSPERLGSGIFKNQFYNTWFSNLVVSTAQKGQFHSSLTLSDAIRTTLTPLTFSKPAFNGLQWDFLTDKYAVTILASRLSSPGFPALTAQTSEPSRSENTSRLLAGRGVGQVGDFAQVGLTWVNVANTTSTLTLGDNSFKGVLTEPQNQGSVETVVVRISDDSPETPQSGALLFFDQVVVNGQPHPEIRPLIRGGIRSEGNLEARGTDVIELIYDIRNDFRPTEDVQDLGSIEKLEFELIIANDYLVEVSSNKQTDRLGGQVFLPVAQASNEVTDGSNQRFINFDYGLPVAHEVIGVDVEINKLNGLDLRAEYAVNRRFRRFPNGNFGVNELDPEKDRAEAAYVTASYSNYPWFAYSEAFDMDPDYSTTAFITNSLGAVDYSDEQRHLFEFVDDNDDQDRFPDWQRINQMGLVGDVVGGADNSVFPGLDENNDFVSDFNQNANSRPDYAEPFLRYAVDPPEFLFGMDMNNNTLIDRFEDDRQPDFPYERDRRGYNMYGGLMLAERTQLNVGRLREKMPSSARKSRSTYGLLTAEMNLPGWNIGLIEHAKWVKDNIEDDRLIWRDPTGSENFNDPLDNQDTFVNTLYLHARYTKVRDLDVQTKVKYETFNQRGDQADLKRDRSFFGLINKAGYTTELTENLTLWPRWKSTFRRETPSSKTSLKSRDLEETLFLVARYSLLSDTWLEGGVEFSWFENLKKRPDEPPPGFVDDFRSQLVSILISNSSAYLGYRLTLNTGLQLRRTKFPKEDTRKESIGFVRIFAAAG